MASKNSPPPDSAQTDRAEATGHVALVGAGPGDPELITVKAIRALQRADVVLYDYLANPRLVEHAPTQAEKICLGGHASGRLWSQDQINQAMVDHARQGARVVRLKGGDPGIFGCIVQEIEALREADIPFSIVPGITTAAAAASYAGLAITHREFASGLALVTGQEGRDKTTNNLKFQQLAQFPGTIVVYMGTTTVARWSHELLAGGKPGETPIAIVRRCSLPDQSVTYCQLDNVVAHVQTDPPLRPPVVFVIGAVAKPQLSFNWYQNQPLFGKRVLITRPRDQADSLAHTFRDLGAEVLLQPAIEIATAPDQQPLKELLDSQNQWDWIVFSSANGVSHFCQQLLNLGHDLRWFGNSRIAVNGPGTAEELRNWHLQADLVPDTYSAEGLAQALVETAKDKSFLLPRASRGRETLRETLQAAGGTVSQITVYENKDVAQADPRIAQRLAEGKIDYVTVTSPAIGRWLAQTFPDSLTKTRLVAISPLTAKTLRERGIQVACVADHADMEGIVAAVLKDAKRST